MVRGFDDPCEVEILVKRLARKGNSYYDKNLFDTTFHFITLPNRRNRINQRDIKFVT